MRPSLIVSLLVLLAPAAAPSQTFGSAGADALSAFGTDDAPEVPPVDLRLFLMGNLGGNLARVRCRESPNIADTDLFYAQQAAEYRRQSALAEAAEQPEPIALNTGDIIFPGSLARFLLSREPNGPERLVRLLNRIPYAGAAVGNQEFGPTRREALAFFESAQELGLPIQAANLRCDPSPEHDKLCAALGPRDRPVIIKRGPLRIAVVSVLDPAIFGRVARNRLEGLKVDDPSAALLGLVPRLRGIGRADLVVVQMHVIGSGAAQKAQQLASSVPGIDVVVTSSLLETPHEDSEPNPVGGRPTGYLVAPRTHTYVVSADTGARHAVVVEARAARRNGEWSVTAFEPRTVATHELPADPDTASMLHRAARDYCRAWGSSIGGVPFAEPFSFTDLRSFVLNAMRFATESQVAVTNAAAFRDEGQFPITGTLTRADLNSALPFSNRLVTAKVSGALLQEIAKRQDGALVTVGLELAPGGKALVNGRPVDAKATYTLVTSAFVAEGGDGLVDPTKLKQPTFFRPEWADEAPSINEVVIQFIERGEFARAGRMSDALSPTLSFPDLNRKFLWTLTGSVNGSYDKVGVSNPERDGAPAYSQSQLTVNSTDQINLEVKALARGDSRNNGWDNELLVQYGTARVRDGEGTRGFEETRDLIRGRSAYKLLLPRANLGDAWWAPIPLAELQVETEFDSPIERDWHKLQLTGILGTSFQLAGPIEAKLGINARRDVNQPAARTTWGLNLGYRLARIDLMSILGKPVQFESDLEYFYNSIGYDNINELRHSDRLYFAVFDQLFFTTTFSTFLVRTGAVGEWGSNAQLTIGLNFIWDKSIQTF